MSITPSWPAERDRWAQRQIRRYTRTAYALDVVALVVALLSVWLAPLAWAVVAVVAQTAVVIITIRWQGRRCDADRLLLRWHDRHPDAVPPLGPGRFDGGDERP